MKCLSITYIFLFSFIGLLAFSSCNSSKSRNEVESEKIEIKGRASFYAKRFEGRKTANGEKYDPSKMTAAHRTLPFGTQVEVTNLQNGKTVKVRINDRGPYRKGRIIDLSVAAAKKLEMIDRGVTPVVIEYERNP